MAADVPRSGSTTRTLIRLPGLIWSSLRAAESAICLSSPSLSLSLSRMSFSSARFSRSSLVRMAPLDTKRSESVTTVIAAGSSARPPFEPPNDSANVYRTVSPPTTWRVWSPFTAAASCVGIWPVNRVFESPNGKRLNRSSSPLVVQALISICEALPTTARFLSSRSTSSALPGMRNFLSPSTPSFTFDATSYLRRSRLSLPSRMRPPTWLGTSVNTFSR